MAQYFLVPFIISILVIEMHSLSIDFDDHVIAKRVSKQKIKVIVKITIVRVN